MPTPEPSETDPHLPELPVKPKTAAQPEVPDFAEMFGSSEKRKPSEWQQLCAQYCAGAQGYLQALMRDLLMATDEEGRTTVMEKIDIVVGKLRQLQNDVGTALKETAAIQAEVETAMSSVKKGFRHAAQLVNKEPDVPTLKPDSPALDDARALIAKSIQSHGISSVLHPLWPRVADAIRQRAEKRRAAKQQAGAGAAPANHTQELDPLEAALPADDAGQEQVVVYEGDPPEGDLPAAGKKLPAVKPPKRAPKTAATSDETRWQFAGRWAGNIASVGIAPAIRAALRARARKQVAAAQESEG